MAKLSAKARAQLPDSVFAGPNRTYPVEDAAHAKAAIMLQNKGGLSASAKKRVVAQAHRVLSK